MAASHPWGPRAPATPRLALSLRRFGREVDQRWPDRNRASDGWLGDAAHRSRASDHNPTRAGIVHAIDLTALGLDWRLVLAAAVQHPSTHYVIFRRTIYAARFRFEPRPYVGEDPHNTHLHVSINVSRTADLSRRSWLGSVK